MVKMTSAYANKVLKKLTEDKEYWLKKENDGSTYVAAVDEEPVIPDYDYSTVAAEIEAIDDKIMKIDRKSTRLNSSHIEESRMPSSA